MKVGDFVRYENTDHCEPDVSYGTILSISDAGMIRVLSTEGEIDFYIPAYCEVILESR